MGIILNTLAILIYAIVHIFDFFITFFVFKKKRGYFREVSKDHFNKAFQLDVFANLQYKNTWGVIFGRSGYQFGRFGETLSSVFGKKRADGSLTYLGYFITVLLDVLWFTDWFEGGHCKKSIMSVEKIIEIKKQIIKQ